MSAACLCMVSSRAQARRLPAPATCLAGEDEPVLVQVMADRVELCLPGAGKAPLRCYAVSFGDGTLTPTPAPAAVEDPAPAVRRATEAPRLDVGDSSVEICRRDGGACKTVRASFEVDPGLGLTATVDPSGARVALAYLEQRTRVEIFEVASGKQLGTFQGQTRNASCIDAEPLGEGVLVSERDCGRDRGVEYLATLTGKRLAAVGGSASFHAARAPVQVTAERWAFTSARGDLVVVQDVRTGKVHKRIKLPRSRKRGSAVAAGDGKHLVVVHGGARLGELSVVDLASYAVTQRSVPRCR